MQNKKGAKFTSPDIECRQRTPILSRNIRMSTRTPDMVNSRYLISLKIEIEILRLADVAAFDVSGNLISILLHGLLSKLVNNVNLE